jgi:hypothetical protein
MDYARSTYTLIRDPALESRIPALKILCGENPVMLCEDSAKAAPINFVFEVEVIPAVAETIVAKVVHLVAGH